MINKKIGTLAAAVLAASSAQAAFEVAFVAVDSDGDTYVHDMGDFKYCGVSLYDFCLRAALTQLIILDNCRNSSTSNELPHLRC